MNTSLKVNSSLAVIVKESGLEPTKAQVILDKFQDYFSIAAEWETKAKSIVVVNETQRADMDMARVGRLFLREKRITIEKTRVELKAQALREGKAIDGISNVLRALFEPIEEYLDKQERFVELKAFAEAELARQEAERKAAMDLIAKQEAEAKEKERLRVENEKLKKEAEAKERERLAVAKKQQEADAKAESERKALEARGKAEKDALEAKAKAEREALEAKNRAEREAAAKKQKEIEDKARAEKEKAQKLADAKLAKERQAKEKIEAELRAKEAAEKARIAEEEAKEKARIEEAERAEEAKNSASDKDKIDQIIKDIEAITMPAVKSKKAKATIKVVEQLLKNLVDSIKARQ